MNKLELMAHKIEVNVKTWMADRAEKGQGSIEYIGIAVIAAIVIAGIVAFFNDTGISDIQDGLSNVISNVFSGSGEYSSGE